MTDRLIRMATVLFVLLAAAFMLFHCTAEARDDGRYAQSPLKGWFSQLRSERGLCCDGADGKRLDDVDWDRDDAGYRVRINGAWVRVPDDAVVTVPNRAGYPMVWPMVGGDGEQTVRCFMPGAGG